MARELMQDSGDRKFLILYKTIVVQGQYYIECLTVAKYEYKSINGVIERLIVCVGGDYFNYLIKIP